MTSIAFSSLDSLSRMIRAGQTDPVEIIEVFLERIARHDEKLHAFVAVHEKEARDAAEGAAKAIRSGHSVGPLHGLPIALKDIIDMEGRITTGGSAGWKDRISPSTATLARRLVHAGMIVIGKTHTVEFAMGGWGTNTHMGTPWNPWDTAVARTPGGSSSGSGVAVAAGLAPAAIGTDTGGSVRLPAAWCGIVGLKCTIGRISAAGVLPLSPTLDTPGPMVRSVTDAALLLTVLQGPDPLDGRTRSLAPSEPMGALERGVAGLRLGVIGGEERDGIDPAVLAAYDETVEVYRRLGAEIVLLDLPRTFMSLGSTTGSIIGAEGYFHVGHMVDDDAAPIDPHIRPRIWIGRDMTAKDYLAALDEQRRIKAAFEPVLASVDALLTPTVATPAVPVDEVDQTGTPARFTRAVNILERCATALPNGSTAEGLPTSFQVICAGGQEALSLQIARAYERETEWGTRFPPEFP